MQSLEYFLILCAFLGFALFVEFGLRYKVFSSSKERFWFTLGTLIIGVIWDTFALSRGHWIFPRGSSLGIKLGLVPIEEYMFILIIPYALLAFRALLLKKLKKRGT